MQPQAVQHLDDKLFLFINHVELRASGVLFGLGQDASIDAVQSRNVDNLHSLALSVQLQTIPVTWDKAISVGMLYFILIEARIPTVEKKDRRCDGNSCTR